MISTELIRRYPFFAGFSHDQLGALAKVADEMTVEAGYYFFREGDELNTYYLVIDGTIAIVIGIPDRDVEQSLTGQLKDDLIYKDITASTVGVGDVFGWSALIPPHASTASAKAATFCRVVAFDSKKLRPILEADDYFAYLMTLKAAQIIRSRLRDKRIESLAEIALRDIGAPE
jgi:CRP-like cAMP-binding protein